MALQTKKKITTTLAPEQLKMVKKISTVTRIAQSELFREAVDDLIRKYHGIVTEEFEKTVDACLERRHALMERFAK
jgi:hypothetical protein